MKQTFTIVWVEDKPRAMASQIEEIQKYLEDKSFSPNIIMDEDGSKFKAAIKEKTAIDIIVTDKNVTSTLSGIDVIKILKSKRKLTDVLFYSSKGFEREDVYKEHYGFIEIVEGKQIVGPLKKLIDKNLRRCEDMVLLRGLVLSMIIDLELKINEFFAVYFQIAEKNMPHFQNFFLESKYGSLIGKKATLSKILKENRIDKDFPGLAGQVQKLGEERNFLAHCKADKKDRNILVCMGEKETFDRSRISSIVDRVNEATSSLEELIEKFQTKK